MNLLPPAEFYAALPSKRSAAIVFYPCPKKTVLIVQPTYKKNWLMPGGVIEKDESPLAAAKRESIEEIGFEKVTDHLLIVNYISTLGYKSEAIHFVFRGETLSEKDLKAINLAKDELIQFKCATLTEAQKVTSKVLCEMLPIAFEALRTGRTHYIEGTTEI